jgi:hypothetical protein
MRESRRRSRLNLPIRLNRLSLRIRSCLRNRYLPCFHYCYRIR